MALGCLLLAIFAVTMQSLFGSFFGPDIPTKRSTETVTFPTGEVLTTEYWVSDGGIDGSEENRLYFQETPSSPIIKWIPEDDSPLSVSQAKVIRHNGFLSMVAVEGHTFEHYIDYGGKSAWGEITSMGNVDAEHFINSFLTPPEVARSQFFRSDSVYWLDRVDFDQNLLVTARHSPNERLPRYLVYEALSPVAPTSVTRLHGWYFDLDRTRDLDGIPPPEDPGLIVDVSVVAGSSGPGWPAREELIKRGGKEIYRQSFRVSSTHWTSFDYSPGLTQTGQVAGTKHYEFRFGYQDVAAQHYTFCWRSTEIFGRQYPSVPIGEWSWTCSSGGGIGPELVFFRARKAD
jgi:hypothetical protein